MPNFNSPFCLADYRANQASHFEAHYASQVALRRVCADLHNDIYNCRSSVARTSYGLSQTHMFIAITRSDTPSSSESSGPTAGSLKQLASRLAQWRGMLPLELQWSEEDLAGYPSPQQTTSPGFSKVLDPQLSLQHVQMGPPLFSSDLDSEPVHYPYLYDLQVALLRTRYYYAKYIVHRPFVYKALHFPERMTQEDAEGAAECLKVCFLTSSTVFIR
jgi:hypothetical protein